jgi:hypothetical protein
MMWTQEMARFLRDSVVSKRAALGLVASAAVAAPAAADTAFTSFAFPAAGATTGRTMPDRLADVVNVKEYGATGNGSTDDAAAIQSAFDAAFGTAGSPHGTSSTLNKAVFFPNGSYLVSTPIVMTRVLGGRIYGAGQQAVTIIGSNVSTGHNAVFKTNGCQDCSFEHLGFTVAGGANSTDVCFDLDWDGTGSVSLNGNQFTDCSFSGGSYGCRIGFSGNDGASNQFYSCTFSSTNNAGLCAYGANAIGNCAYGGGSSNNVGAGYWSKSGQIAYVSNLGTSDNFPDILLDSAFPFMVKCCRSESLQSVIQNNANGVVYMDCCVASNVGFTLTTSSSTSSGSTLNFSSTPGVVNGTYVSGTNIPIGTTVASFTPTTVVLSAPVSGTVAMGATISFVQEPVRTKGKAIMDGYNVPSGAVTRIGGVSGYTGTIYIRAIVNLGNFSGSALTSDFTTAGGTLGQNI